MNLSNKPYPDFVFESWIVGFIDSEGCFCVSFTNKSKLSLGIDVRASFSVSQESRSILALEKLKNISKCGSLRFSKKDGTYTYEVRNFQDLTHKILPFFFNYYLFTNKRNDFALFSEICSLIKQNQHRSKKGLIQIIELAYQMNEVGIRKRKKEELLKILESKTFE
uniref:Homing endonuclease LAGLIDADG domain-containing protein n=1 Tax=Monomastix sp. M722 TaxID=141717 RepID=Q8SML2_9CHLO|nr:unknown [Monomastix sp. M722]